MNDAPRHDDVPALDREARLTAYVLGELDEHDAAEVERRLADDEALRAEVDGIRAAAEGLSACLAAEPAPGLTADQREAIVRGGDAPVVHTFRRTRTLWAGLGLAAAACLAVVFAWPILSRTTGDARYAKSDVAAALTAKESAGRKIDDVIKDARDRRDRSSPEAGSAPSALSLEPNAEIGAMAGAPLEKAAQRQQFGEALHFQDGADEALHAYAVTGAVADGDEHALLRGDQAAKEATALGDRLSVGRGSAPVADAPAPAKRAAPGAGIGGGTGYGLGGGDVARRAPAETDAPPGLWSRDRAIRERLEEGETDSRFGAELPRQRDPGAWSREDYDRLVDNDFLRPVEEPLSTFSVDVDTASYSNVRRFIESGALPPRDAVRIEELINYFDYAYEPATGEHPFSVNVETNACPWNPAHRLVRIGLRGREVARDMRPATSLVFLVDVSGSMKHASKLPLLQRSLRMLVENLTADDRVALVVYAGASGLVLPSTYCDDREAILSALENLRAGGSTNGGAGIELAYGVAQESFIPGGVNRVVLCTDGDFNVGVTGSELTRLVEEKRETGVFLSILGFGTGNLQDRRMEELTNKGNGNYFYIDSLDEARKVLVEEMAGTLVAIAKDVKVQVEFNPARVGAYRLVGYANRLLAARDFNDDRKDAGEIGAGHTVTALYEIAPPGEGAVASAPATDDLKYQERAVADEAAASDEILTVKLRYKAPDGDVSRLIERPVVDDGAGPADASADFRFASAVAAFGMILRDSPHRGDATLDSVLALAKSGERPTRATLGLEAAPAPAAAPAKPAEARRDHRADFIHLVERAKAIRQATNRR